MQSGGNNGIAIRTPWGGHASTEGIEIQLLDDDAHKNAGPTEICGAVYGIVGAKRGASKPAGQWNRIEIRAQGRRIAVVLNDKQIVDANLNEVANRRLLAERPGFLQERGHIGFLGHGSRTEFRNIHIAQLPPSPPDGFVSLMNERHWQGWIGRLPDIEAMSPADRAKAQTEADAVMRENWKFVDGELRYTGKGRNLVSAKEYRDFELVIDWKISTGGDSGIYLRGSPQIQIWDNPVGSGGPFNNAKNPNNPSKKADNPPGEWNRFRILLIDDRVTVFLNDQLIVKNVQFENYWDKEKPLPESGRIELQHHGNPLTFRNIAIREIAPTKP